MVGLADGGPWTAVAALFHLAVGRRLGGRGASGSLAAGRIHEYGTTLLTIAGIVNLLAVSSALDLAARGKNRQAQSK